MTETPYDHDLLQTAHRPYPHPTTPWRLRQSWHNLLFAHWPIPPAQLAPLLPPTLTPDLHAGQAWLGVVPFTMRDVRTRLPILQANGPTLSIPTTTHFLELNLRTYVRSRRTGLPGVFFFALDCNSLLSVLGARTLFHLPYFPARMTSTQTPTGIHYTSRRQLTRLSVLFDATYEPTGPATPPDPLTIFLTERYCLFTTSGSKLLIGHIHHLPWTLQPAQAEIRTNDLPQAHGFTLPQTPPLLHYSESLRVTLWPLTTE